MWIFRESDPFRSLSARPTRRRRWRSATCPVGDDRAGVVCYCPKGNKKTRAPTLHQDIYSSTRGRHTITGGSPGSQVDCDSFFTFTSAKIPANHHVDTRLSHVSADQSASAADGGMASSLGARLGLRCSEAGSPSLPCFTVKKDLPQTLRATIAPFRQLDQSRAAPCRLEKSISSVNIRNGATREAARMLLPSATEKSGCNPEASSVRFSTLKECTRVPSPTLGLQRSLSSVCLLSRRALSVAVAADRAAQAPPDPTKYSRLPPEVWVYKYHDLSSECSPSESTRVHVQTKVTSDRRRTQVVCEGESSQPSKICPIRRPTRQKLSLNGKSLVFPQERPDGHQQAEFLCSCVPAMLELNSVPTLFSLKHGLVAVNPTVSASSRQAPSSETLQPPASTASISTPPDEKPAVLNPDLLRTDRGSRSQKVTPIEQSSARKIKSGVSASASAVASASFGVVPAVNSLSKGLQAANEACTLSEWWGGLINVVDISLSELHRQLKTFAPFHAKCLDVIRQMLVDYAEVHQQVQARHLSQVHTSLLDVHAVHAALRKETFCLEQRTEKLQAKAREAEELRRLLDIHAHLYSLEEIEVLTAQQTEEDVTRTEFQWHQLQKVIDAVKGDEDDMSSAEVWTSDCTEGRQNHGHSTHSQPLLTAVLPTVVTLLPHETVVQGKLDSSAHARLLRIYIPPGRWNLGIAVTCSQPLDASLLLLLATNHTVSQNREKEADCSRRKVTARAEGRNNALAFSVVPSPRGSSPPPDLLISPASLSPLHRISASPQNNTVSTPVKATEAAELHMKPMQVESFASFRICPEEPQILQVAMPAAGSPDGGWLLVRLQGTLCRKRGVVQKAVEACRKSLLACSPICTDQGTAVESAAEPQALAASVLLHTTTGNEEKSLKMIGTACKPLPHHGQDDNPATFKSALRSGQLDQDGSHTVGDKPLGKRTSMSSLGLDRDSLLPAAATYMKEEELRFSLTVHSVFLHKSAAKVETVPSAGMTRPTLNAQANKAELQPSNFAREDSFYGLGKYRPDFYEISAHSSSPSGWSEGPSTFNARPRCQYNRPPLLVLRRDANTQTIKSKLFRGFIRKLHEGPRPPPIPQFCVCDAEIQERQTPHIAQSPAAVSRGHTDSAPPREQINTLEVPALRNGGLSGPHDADINVASPSAPSVRATGELPLESAVSIHEVEPPLDACPGAIGDAKVSHYHAPSYPILKVLLDETPIALGDFTVLLQQNDALRDAADVPTPFKGSNFMRWPPRLLAETVWIILLQHTRSTRHGNMRTLALHGQQQPSGVDNIIRTPGSSTHPNPSPARSSPDAVSSADVADRYAPWQGAAAGKLDKSCALESDRHLNASLAEHTAQQIHNEILPNNSAPSLATNTLKYFLSRLNVAFIARGVLQSFLLSILYWSPTFAALSPQPRQPTAGGYLHKPLLFSGSIYMEEAATATSIESPSGGKRQTETVRESAVIQATSKARGFIPWFAVGLFGRITGLLSTSRDTAFFRRSLDDFVRLELQACLEELTLIPPRRRRGCSVPSARETEKLTKGSVSSDVALSRTLIGKALPRRKDSMSHSIGGLDSSFILPVHLKVPKELCLATTHRAAARIAVRIFSEEGTSEYRAAALHAITYSKNAALALIRQPKPLSRWALHRATAASSSICLQDSLDPRPCQGRTSTMQSVVGQESGLSRKEKRSTLFVGLGEGQTSTAISTEDAGTCTSLPHQSANDESWDLPMPVDLLIQILTQQWEILYVHLQQAMEQVLDETHENPFEPLMSLSAFGSFIGRLNSKNTKTPEDVLRLYYKALSSTSSRLRPSCSSLPSSALSALLLHRPCLLDFPLPFPPSPFLTLAPLVKVVEPSQGPQFIDTCTLAQPEAETLPLWSLHAYEAPQFVKAQVSMHETRSVLDLPGKANSAGRVPLSSRIVSSTSHEVHLAAFIVDGLMTFLQTEVVTDESITLKKRRPYKDEFSSADISKIFSKEYSSGGGPRNAKEELQQKRAGREPLPRSNSHGTTGGDPGLVDPSKQHTIQTASSASVYVPTAGAPPIITDESAVDAYAVAGVCRDMQTPQPLRFGKDCPRQVIADGFYHTSGTRITGPLKSAAGGRQRPMGENVPQAHAAICTTLGGSIPAPHAEVTGAQQSQGCRRQNEVFHRLFASTDDAPDPQSFSGDRRLSEDDTYNPSFNWIVHTGNSASARVCNGVPTFGQARRPFSRAFVPYLDVVLDRSMALATAKEIEEAAKTNALLQVFGGTDLPRSSAGDTAPESHENSAAESMQADVARSLEGFTPSGGRLSPHRQPEGGEKQILSCADVDTAQALLRCIWSAIFKIFTFIAEERERRTTLEHMFALQRVQNPAATKEALGELARIYRDQVDRLLILNVGSDGVSALMQQPELRAQLLLVHQRLNELEKQQLSLQQTFSSAAAAVGAASKIKPTEEEYNKP